MIHLLSDFRSVTCISTNYPKIGQNEKFDICDILSKISIDINLYLLFFYKSFEKFAICTCESKKVIWKKVVILSLLLIGV